MYKLCPKYFHTFKKQASFRDVSEKLAKYQDLRSDDRMKDFLTAPQEEFTEICKSIARAMKLEVREFKNIANGCEMLVVEGESKWRNVRKVPRLIQCLRTSEVIEESSVRSLHESMKRTNVNRGILITNSTYTHGANDFAETRPIDLFDKDYLVNILKAALEY